MKQLLLFCIILILFRVTALSQSCLPEGITFTTQAQIDSFQLNYPGCDKIEGSRGIGSNEGGTNITNLYGLGGLHSIGGDLSIWNNNNLTSLAGLNFIESVGGHLEISNNQALTSLYGLGSLYSAWVVTISNNLTLHDLSGLENLRSIEYILDIEDNPSLTSLMGLANLDSVTDGHLSSTTTMLDQPDGWKTGLSVPV
jgi:hypothetical protein